MSKRKAMQNKLSARRKKRTATQKTKSANHARPAAVPSRDGIFFIGEFHKSPHLQVTSGVRSRLMRDGTSWGNAATNPSVHYYCGFIMVSTLCKLRALVLGFSLGIPLALAQAPLRADAQDASDIVVLVKKNGATIIVDVEMAVHASPLAAWDVLTDYDHMAQFVGNVQSLSLIHI